MSRSSRVCVLLLAASLVPWGACGGSSAAAHDAAADATPGDDATAPDGSGSGSDATTADAARDAAGDDAEAADAGCPLPVGEVPGTGLGDAGVGMVLHAVIPTAPNRAAVFLSAATGPNAIRAQAWDGATWTHHAVTPDWVQAAANHPTFAQQGGHPIVFAPMATLPQPFWIELPGGDYSSAQTITGLTHHQVSAAAWFPADNVLLAAADDPDGANSVSLIERGADDSLNVALVDIGSTSVALGVGRLTDNTPWIGVQNAVGDLNLWRRAGTTWSVKQKLVGVGDVGSFGGLGVWGPTSGAGKGLTLFVTWSAGTDLWGQTWSADTGAPAGNTLLVDEIGAGVLKPAVLYDADGQGITFVVHQASSGRAWIGHAQGSAFETTAELRPDLIFDDPPVLFRSTCGDAMIAYHARTNAQAARSQPVKIEKLADFRSQ